MANANLQAAASNLRRASNDFKINIDKIQADANNQKREMEKRIDKLKSEQSILNARSRAGDDPGSSEALVLSTKLNDEISDLEKSVFTIQDSARKQIDGLNNQMNDLNILAQRLESSA